MVLAAVVGSVLILTKSSLFEPLREWLRRHGQRTIRMRLDLHATDPGEQEISDRNALLSAAEVAGALTQEEIGITTNGSGFEVYFRTRDPAKTRTLLPLLIAISPFQAHDLSFEESPNRLRGSAIFLTLWRLSGCPMCAGFWVGLLGAVLSGERGAMALVCAGPTGSLASAFGVGLWVLLTEGTSLCTTLAWAAHEKIEQKDPFGPLVSRLSKLFNSPTTPEDT